MGLEYDDTISCAEVVSISASYSKCSSLAVSLLSLYVFWLINFMDYILFSHV